MHVEAFRQGMRALGYIDGQHYVLEIRFADAKLDRLPGLAAELVALKVDINRFAHGANGMPGRSRLEGVAIPCGMTGVARPEPCLGRVWWQSVG